MSEIKKATRKLIGQVWSITYKEVDGGVEILRHEMDDYDLHGTLPLFSFFMEGDKNNRVVTGIVIAPYADNNPRRPSDCYFASEEAEGAIVYDVVNPKRKFAYNDEEE